MGAAMVPAAMGGAATAAATGSDGRRNRGSNGSSEGQRGAAAMGAATAATVVEARVRDGASDKQRCQQGAARCSYSSRDGGSSEGPR